MKAWDGTNGVLDRLDGLSPWAFTASLYLVRWTIVVPIAYAIGSMGVPNSGARLDASPIVLLFGFILLAPLLETLVECAVPYWLMRKMRATRASKRAWGFVAVSALIMALLHMGAWPSAILPSLVTGSFLAYTYNHFVTCGTATALLHTCVFHAAINLVGWVLMFGL